MTPFEWIIGLLVTGLYASGFAYYRMANRRINEVKKEILVIRNNDLKHIEDNFKQLRDQIFALAKDK